MLKFLKWKKEALSLPTPAIPIDRWLREEANVTELKALLNQPVMQQALALLKERANPSAVSVTADPTANSHSYSWCAGYHDALSDLTKLAQTKAPKPKPTNEEWMHIQNPQ